jgi:hypothetical protein
MNWFPLGLAHCGNHQSLFVPSEFEEEVTFTDQQRLKP